MGGVCNSALTTAQSSTAKSSPEQPQSLRSNQAPSQAAQAEGSGSKMQCRFCPRDYTMDYHRQRHERTHHFKLWQAAKKQKAIQKQENDEAEEEEVSDQQNQPSFEQQQQNYNQASGRRSNSSNRKQSAAGHEDGDAKQQKEEDLNADDGAGDNIIHKNEEMEADVTPGSMMPANEIDDNDLDGANQEDQDQEMAGGEVDDDYNNLQQQADQEDAVDEEDNSDVGAETSGFATQTEGAAVYFSGNERQLRQMQATNAEIQQKRANLKKQKESQASKGKKLQNFNKTTNSGASIRQDIVEQAITEQAESLEHSNVSAINNTAIGAATIQQSSNHSSLQQQQEMIARIQQNQKAVTGSSDQIVNLEDMLLQQNELSRINQERQEGKTEYIGCIFVNSPNKIIGQCRNQLQEVLYLVTYQSVESQVYLPTWCQDWLVRQINPSLIDEYHKQVTTKQK